MQFKYILLTIVAAIGWGFSGTCSEHLFKTYGTNGEWLTSIRLLTAGLLLILISLASGQGRALLGILRNKRDRWTLLFFAVIGMMAVQYTYLTAIAHTNSGTATVLQYSGPAFVLFYICLTTRRLPIWRESASLVGILVGVFSSPPTATSQPSRSPAPGSPGAWPRRFFSLPTTSSPSHHPALGQSAGDGAQHVHRRHRAHAFDAPSGLRANDLSRQRAHLRRARHRRHGFRVHSISRRRRQIGPVKASIVASIEPIAASIFSFVWVAPISPSTTSSAWRSSSSPSTFSQTRRRRNNPRRTQPANHTIRRAVFSSIPLLLWQSAASTASNASPVCRGRR